MADNLAHARAWRIPVAPLMPADFAYDLTQWDGPTSPCIEPFETFVERAIAAGDHVALDAAATAIDLLDAFDGDPDLEPCSAGDDGCHFFICGRREGWGYDFDQSDGPAPVYGDDQSEGPLNSMGLPRAEYAAHAWRG